MIEKIVYARIGLLGNPSDHFLEFKGKTLACKISNFKATVKLSCNGTSKISFLPNQKLDNIQFESLLQFEQQISTVGYGGVRKLLLATLYKFINLAQTMNWKLKASGFDVTYSTSIPRQVGLSGSSAFILAFTQCLLEFYEIPNSSMSKHQLVDFILKVETEELGINAGPMDRVSQVYSDAVYMDFAEEEPIYTSLPKKVVVFLNRVGFFLAYLDKDRDSGKVHSNVTKRYRNRDRDVLVAMTKFAAYCEEGRNILLSTDINSMKRYGELMNKNFDLRRQIYGDEVIGIQNVKLVELLRSFGVYCKFCGSGGSFYAFLIDPSEEVMIDIRKQLKENGFNYEKVSFC